MPSPFPGMDPYLESWIWGDVHSSTVHQIRDQINPILPKQYFASVELYIRNIDPETEERALREPDVFVSEPSARPKRKSKTSAGAAVIAPHESRLPVTTRKQRYVRITDHSGRRVVTVIELLSPSNKMGGE